MEVDWFCFKYAVDVLELYLIDRTTAVRVCVRLVCVDCTSLTRSCTGPLCTLLEKCVALLCVDGQMYTVCGG